MSRLHGVWPGCLGKNYCFGLSRGLWLWQVASHYRQSKWQSRWYQQHQEHDESQHQKYSQSKSRINQHLMICDILWHLFFLSPVEAHWLVCHGSQKLDQESRGLDDWFTMIFKKHQQQKDTRTQLSKSKQEACILQEVACVILFSFAFSLNIGLNNFSLEMLAVSLNMIIRPLGE